MLGSSVLHPSLMENLNTMYLSMVIMGIQHSFMWFKTVPRIPSMPHRGIWNSLWVTVVCSSRPQGACSSVTLKFKRVFASFLDLLTHPPAQESLAQTSPTPMGAVPPESLQQGWGGGGV